MAQRVRALAVLPEDPSSIPRPHGGSQASDSNLREPDALF